MDLAKYIIGASVLETPHAIVGAAIASKIPNPFISLPLAFASHFVLDRIPHWNPHLNTELKNNGKVTEKSKKIIALDVVSALSIGISIAFMKLPDQNAAIYVLLGAFCAVLPDLVEGPYFFWNIRTKAIDRWLKFQKSIQNDTSALPGLAIQLVTVIMAIWWIMN